MEAIKFDEKSLSRFPVAFYFSAVEAFDKRIMAAEGHSVDVGVVVLHIDTFLSCCP